MGELVRMRTALLVVADASTTLPLVIDAIAAGKMSVEVFELAEQ